MPGYKGHLCGGAAIFAGLWLVLTYYKVYPSSPLALEWLFCALSGALFPDIDVKSKGQNYFYKLLLVLLILFLLKGYIPLFIVCSIIAVTPMIVRHRGLFHRLWFVVLFPAAIACGIILCYPRYKMIVVYDIIFFIAGAISHLYLDLGLKGLLRF